MSITFFIDFDGTITKKDSCIAVAKAFAKGNWENIDSRWQNKELTTKEAARETFRMFETDKEKFTQFLLDEIEIDDYFITFFKHCTKMGYKMYILSDGYDFHIKTILEKYNIDLPYYANKLMISDNKFDLETIYSSIDCNQCGTCKTQLIKKLRPNKGLTVYIGDGYSDMCAAKNADIIFAKNALLSYCRENHIPAQEFDNFSKINDWLLKRICRR